MSLSAIHRKIVQLEQQMAAAAAAEDFEAAARLRDEIAALRAEDPDRTSPLVRKPPPGEMGLGTNVPVAAPPAGWRRPRRPDPMTRGHRPGGRR